jgi:hypothetical protein
MAKTKKAKKKRVLSAAQKAALARGRAKMAAKRGKKSTSVKRKASRKVKRSEPSKALTVINVEPKKIKRKKSSTSGVKSMARKKSSGGSKVASVGRKAGSFIRGAGTAGMLRNAGLALAGGIASGFLVNKFPVKDARIKAALPIIGGIVLSGTLGKRNNTVKGVAEGMVMLGAVSLFKQLAPGIPFLAGEQQYFIPAGIPYIPGGQLPAPADQSTSDLGFMGENVSMGIDEYYSAIDL